MYIAIEGIKGSGKSTLLAQLQQQLNQEGIQFVTFNPTRPMPESMWWEQVYPTWQYDDQFVAALYTARANYHAQHTDFNQPLVLGDRSIFTSLTTRWHLHSDKAKFMQQVFQQEYAVPLPDVMIYLNISVEQARQRIQHRQRDYGQQDETLLRLQQVQDAYAQLFKHQTQFGLEHIDVQHFDADQNPEQLFYDVYKKIILTCI